MSIKDMLCGIDNCICGKGHSCPIDYIEIGDNALKKLPQICMQFKRILLVADQNTYKAAGEEASKLISDRLEEKLILGSECELLIPDEKALDTIRAKVSDKTDLIVGVGSGVINDLCKEVSFEKNLPYYIIATAPSMDGYASVGAALILGGMKVTLNARPPKAIIADADIIRQAPIDMIKAGYGDIIGKFSCLADWKLAALLRSEYFCRAVYELTLNTAKAVRTLAKKIAERNGEAISALMEALVAVGIAMAYVGNSRPASGCEHHLSHYFEITGILNAEEYFAHGIDVGFSAVKCAELREKMLKSAPEKQTFDKNAWLHEIRRIYSASADGIISMQEKLGWYNEDDSKAVTEKWSEVCDILSEVPTAADFISMLDEVGLNYSDFETLYGKKKIDDAVLYAKDLKDRYTILWLYYKYFREAY